MQWQSRDQIWNFFKFKMADGRHIGKCWKCYNSPTNCPIWTKRGWSHAINSQTWPPWCSCHGNGRCLATVHWIFSSYGRLEAERVIQFWWNLAQSSKFGNQWQSRDQIWKVLKFKLADGRHMEKCWKCYNSPTSGPSWTKLRWWHPVISATCSPWCSYHGNGRCLATVHWTFNSCGRLEVELVIQFWWNLEPTLSITVLHRSFTPGWKHTIITNPSHFCYCPQPGLPSRIIGLCTGRLMLIGLF